MKPTRILVFSASFGAGHIKAAEALIQAVKNMESTAEIIHEDFMDRYNKVLNKLIRNSYINVIKRAPKLWGTFYESTQDLTYDSLFQRVINNIGRKQLLEHIHNLNPDIIICTYPTIAGLLAHLRVIGELKIPLATVITDYTTHCQWIHPGVDLYIVGSSQVRDGLIKRGINPETIKVTGIPVSPKFDVVINKKEAQLSLGLSDQRHTFLVMGGAYGVLGDAKWMCQFLATVNAPIQVIVVCGNDRKLYRSLDSVVEEAHNPLVRFDFVNNVDLLMAAADVIITKAGGLTVSEALTKNLPMIIFKPIPGQEENNALFIEDIGAGKLAYTQQEFISVFCEIMQKPNILKQMRQAAAREFPGNSAERAVQAIVSLAYKSPANFESTNRNTKQTSLNAG